SDGEPDGHAGGRPVDSGEHEEKIRMSLQVPEPVGPPFAPRLPLRDRQVNPAANREMRNQDVDDRDDADHPPAADYRHVPHGPIHLNTPRLATKDHVGWVNRALLARTHRPVEPAG